jgi:hypothetical protein
MKSARRTFRIPDNLYHAAQAYATRRKETISQVVRRKLQEYLREGEPLNPTPNGSYVANEALTPERHCATCTCAASRAPDLSPEEYAGMFDYEDDEPVADVVTAFDASEKVTTQEPTCGFHVRHGEKVSRWCQLVNPQQPPTTPGWAPRCALPAGHSGWHSCYPMPESTNHTAYSLWSDPTATGR